jgi:hypothetical protein
MQSVDRFDEMLERGERIIELSNKNVAPHFDKFHPRGTCCTKKMVVVVVVLIFIIVFGSICSQGYCAIKN